MSFQTWWMFVVMTFVVSATPGPNMLLVMSSSARFGFPAAMRTMAGCMTALVAMMGISAAGLGAVLHNFPSVFDALRLLGAAYLAYLGLKTWRARTEPDASAASFVMEPAARRHYQQGFLVAASNPKAILFAAAFFPQFIQPALPQWPQFAALLSTFVVIEVGWYLIYAASGQRLSHFLRRPSVMHIFNRVTGGVFIGFAALMALPRA